MHADQYNPTMRVRAADIALPYLDHPLSAKGRNSRASRPMGLRCVCHEVEWRRWVKTKEPVLGYHLRLHCATGGVAGGPEVGSIHCNHTRAFYCREVQGTYMHAHQITRHRPACLAHEEVQQPLYQPCSLSVLQFPHIAAAGLESLQCRR